MRGGYTLRAGPWLEAIDFFARQGFQCPTFKNPSDFFLYLVSTDPAAVAQLSKQQELDSRTSRPFQLQTKISQGSAADEPELELEPKSAFIAGLPAESGAVLLHVTVPWQRQVYYLVRRNLRTWWRHPLMLAGEGVQFVLLSLFIGA